MLSCERRQSGVVYWQICNACEWRCHRHRQDGDGHQASSRPSNQENRAHLCRTIGTDRLRLQGSSESVCFN